VVVVVDVIVLQSVDSGPLLLQIGTGRDAWCDPRRLGSLARRPERFGGHEGRGVVSRWHSLSRTAEGKRERGQLLLLFVETSERRRRTSSRDHVGAVVWDEMTVQGMGRGMVQWGAGLLGHVQCDGLVVRGVLVYGVLSWVSKSPVAVMVRVRVIVIVGR